MKKIGVLHGKERSFPMAFVERVNGKNISGIMAEPVRIDKAIQGEPTGYAVIIDRISQDIPFYRTWLKNEALTVPIKIKSISGISSPTIEIDRNLLVELINERIGNSSKDIKDSIRDSILSIYNG